MLEIELATGKSGTIKSKYDYVVKIGKSDKGYILITPDLKRGPFSKVFLHKLNDSQIIVCNADNESRFYKLEEKELKLIHRSNQILTKEKDILLEIKKIEDFENANRFPDCDFLGRISDYLIYTHDFNSYFVLHVSTNEESIKFPTYEALVDYYKNKGINLFSTEIIRKTNKAKKCFIKFEDLYNHINSLNEEDFSHLNLIDILLGKDLFKDMITKLKEKYMITTTTSKEAANLLNNNYTELPFQSIEKLNQLFPQEMSQLHDLLIKKANDIKLSCSKNLKKMDNINFEELRNIIKEIQIEDIDDKVKREIGGKRPLTASMFHNILYVSLCKLQDIESTFIEDYKMGKNFKVVYPQEYESLWNLTLEKLPDLYDQFLKYQQEKFTKMLKKG